MSLDCLDFIEDRWKKPVLNLTPFVIFLLQIKNENMLLKNLSFIDVCACLFVTLMHLRQWLLIAACLIAHTEKHYDYNNDHFNLTIYSFCCSFSWCLCGRSWRGLPGSPCWRRPRPGTLTHTWTAWARCECSCAPPGEFFPGIPSEGYTWYTGKACLHFGCERSWCDGPSVKLKKKLSKFSTGFV